MSSRHVPFPTLIYSNMVEALFKNRERNDHHCLNQRATTYFTMYSVVEQHHNDFVVKQLTEPAEDE